MKAGAEKKTFCEKHKRHSKTLRKEWMLKQDENALKIYLEGQIFVLQCELFFPWRKYPACYCALPEERSTNIPENVHVYLNFSLQMMQKF